MPLSRPFSAALLTRGYETDTTGYVPMYMFFHFVEMARWEMMQAPSLGLVDKVHEGHFFVVRHQEVELLRHIGQGVPLEITTRFTHCGRSTVGVYHEALRRDTGTLVARARAEGVWIGPHRRIARIPNPTRDACKQQLEALGDPLAGGQVTPHDPHHAHHGGHATSFIHTPEIVNPGLGLGGDPPLPSDAIDGAFSLDVRVMPRDLDIFSHVNAATYLRYIEDARWHGARDGALSSQVGPQGFVVRASVKYLRETTWGTALRCALSEDGEVSPGGEGGGINAFISSDYLHCMMRLDTRLGARPISPATSSC